MANQHRSAMGKIIDMDVIRSKNEHVRAVGNMPVNARGDTIDSIGRVIEPITTKLNKQHQQVTQDTAPGILPDEMTIDQTDLDQFDEPNPTKD
jgi:hypothetical protein